LLGGLFTAAAKRIAADIQKSVNDLMQQYSNGQTTLVATISGLEQERNNAIAQLSGQKGGQDQLNKLLPQIDQQIAQLKLQQKQVLETFTQNLAVLQTHSTVLGQVLSTWTQINKQVKDYLDAGGSAAKAAEFLSLSLEQQLTTAQNSLRDAESQALQDAMQLNDLLTQRVNLAKQFAQQEFALRNQDALERAGNPAIAAALAYQQQQAANAAQLTALDQQITLYTSRVSMEKQVFNLAQSTTDLQAESNRLNLSALQQTIQGWKDLQKIIAAISQNAAGLYGINPNLFTPASAGTTNNSTKSVTIGTLNVSTQATDAAGVARAISQELALVGQFGANTSYA
jgi:chromosome segregation ATPase